GAPPAQVEEVGRASESLGEDVAAVVVDERVGHDEMPPSLHVDEIGQVVVVGVGVVDEAALLDDELARVDAGAVAAVPAERPLAARPLDRLDRPLDVLPVRVAVEEPVLLPAPAVAARLVARLARPLPRLARALP